MKVLITIILTLAFCCGVASANIVPSMTDYGNGVLFFINSHEFMPPGFGDNQYQEFGEALSEYMSQHPNQRVADIVSDDSDGSSGSSRGFYVIVENKTPAKIVCLPGWNKGGEGIDSYVCQALP